MYVEEKIGLAQQATDVKNMGGFIVKAIRENYQDPVFQRELQVRKAVRKIDHKLTVYGTEDNCLKQDLRDL